MKNESSEMYLVRGMQQSPVPALKILTFLHEGSEYGGLLSHGLFQGLDLTGGVADAGGRWTGNRWGIIE